MTEPHYHPTLGNEIANSVTHGVGALVSTVGLVYLMILAGERGTGWHIVSCAIYGVTLLLLYIFSTLYHALPGQKAKYVFRIFDHSSIYLLIAGTYTPFMLVSLRGPWGWSILTVIWALAISGIVFKSVAIGRFAVLSAIIYVLMGWLVVIAIRPLLHAIPWNGFLWLVAGGVCYTAGVIFFATDRIHYFHMIWHLFVLAGSACHYMAVMRSVIPTL
jgi:hemolysin III